MRRSTPLLSTLLAVLTLAVAAGPAAAQGSKPVAVPLEPIKNFDVVAKGDVIHHVFEIRNEGQATLELTDVRPACGCTVADFDKKIAPGKVGKIDVKVKTENFAGPISKSVAVFTNDTENPKIQLVVKALVKPYLGVEPGYARFNFVQGVDPATIPQTIWSEDGSDFKVLDVKAPYDYLKVSFHEATAEERNDKAEGRQWRVNVQLASDAPVGALRDYVDVTLDHPKQKIVKIPISGFVRPRQHVTPEKGDFGEVQSGTLPLQQTFQFTNFITEKIDLTKVETGVAGITAEVRPNEQEAGYRFRLVLTISPEVPKGPFRTTVKIHTTDKKNPVVELPIQGTVL